MVSGIFLHLMMKIFLFLSYERLLPSAFHLVVCFSMLSVMYVVCLCVFIV